jgi:hypothetical protein
MAARSHVQVRVRQALAVRVFEQRVKGGGSADVIAGTRQSYGALRTAAASGSRRRLSVTSCCLRR